MGARHLRPGRRPRAVHGWHPRDGFGVTSATVLLLLGISPITASAATHAAKLPTTLVSVMSHWRAGNVDVPVLAPVALPGALDGFLGAVVLTNVSLASAKGGHVRAAHLLRPGILARFGLGVRVIPTPMGGRQDGCRRSTCSGSRRAWWWPARWPIRP